MSTQSHTRSSLSPSLNCAYAMLWKEYSGIIAPPQLIFRKLNLSLASLNLAVVNNMERVLFLICVPAVSAHPHSLGFKPFEGASAENR